MAAAQVACSTSCLQTINVAALTPASLYLLHIVYSVFCCIKNSNNNNYCNILIYVHEVLQLLTNPPSKSTKAVFGSYVPRRSHSVLPSAFASKSTRDVEQLTYTACHHLLFCYTNLIICPQFNHAQHISYNNSAASLPQRLLKYSTHISTCVWGNSPVEVWSSKDT